MHSQTPICYMTETRAATKDAPALYRFELRRQGGNVLYAQDIEKDTYPDMVNKVRENPSAYGL